MNYLNIFLIDNKKTKAKIKARFKSGELGLVKPGLFRVSLP